MYSRFEEIITKVLMVFALTIPASGMLFIASVTVCAAFNLIQCETKGICTIEQRLENTIRERVKCH